jgi:dTDP-glucose pyrophosphorylase
VISESMLNSLVVQPSLDIRSAARAIQSAEIKILLVCDEERKLLGTLTDGDIRRAVSNGDDLNGPVRSIMNNSPKVAQPDESEELLRTRMRASIIRHMPKVDSNGHLIGLAILGHLDDVRQREAAVVLMAGGRGSRLMPLTANRPKPLLHVGKKPVLERQIEQLIDQGFYHFYISVNYLGHMIEEHFGDGSRLNVRIEYIREAEPLGTAGSLCLLPRQEHPIIVMNGDIITKADFGKMLDNFVQEGVAATMAVREHHYTVPYGCVSMEDGRIVSLDEKPTFRHLINAGLYVISPQTLEHLPKGRFFDMPQLFETLIAKGHSTNSYLVSEEWIDIGHKEDLMWAQQVFGGDE